MSIHDIERLWKLNVVLRGSFAECLECLRNIEARMQAMVKTSAGIKGFKVEAGCVPADILGLRRNLFSTLFQSVYRLLGVDTPRRLLYGRLNYLFRMWVTSADNLLDGESKFLIPLKMSGGHRVMREVISIMAADRVMKSILDDASAEAVISREQSKRISERTLNLLLPSAAQEATEEGGIIYRAKPGYVLNTIHYLKTATLFRIPLLGPEDIEEEMDRAKLQKIRSALGRFGLGCQLLDDIRDMAKDHIMKRHNYVLSDIFWNEDSSEREALASLEGNINAQEKISLYFPDSARRAKELAMELLGGALSVFDEFGLELGISLAKAISIGMMYILDTEELIDERDSSALCALSG